ncbi:hypothetical protein [Candidatus Uabimicrobium sp. HlEnr_7]|uniref:hypothetical protein n=1 Tax=Candidatus Uabimicrobium helgolandensis TaxID=3095367 RepID=UPI003558DCC4
MKIGFDLLTNYSNESYPFSCAKRVIKNKNKNIEVYFYRIWGIEVSPSFSNAFCFVVYESDKYCVLAILMEKKSLFERNKNLDLMELIKKSDLKIDLNNIDNILENPEKYCLIKLTKDDFIFQQYVVDSKKVEDISSTFLKTNLSFEPNNKVGEDGIYYNFKMCLVRESIDLSFHSCNISKYEPLLNQCIKIAKLISERSKNTTVKMQLKNWMNLFKRSSV